MRKLIWIISVIFALWSGYWVIGAYKTEKTLLETLEKYKTLGWAIDFSKLKVRGFPNRFDTTIENLNIISPEDNIGWSTPYFQILSLSYKPNHLIAIWPKEHELKIANNILSIRNKKMQSSLIFKDLLFSEIDRIVLTTEDLQLLSSEKVILNTNALNIALRQDQLFDDAYEIGVSVKNFFLPSFTNVHSDTLNITPLTLGLSVKIHLSKKTNFSANSYQGLRLTEININQADLSSNLFAVMLKGNIDINQTGTPSGRIDIQIENLRELMLQAININLLASYDLDEIIKGLNFISKLSGDPKSLEFSIKIQEGKMFIGPIPVGQIPNIILQ
jgi:hypothetical protein